MISWSSSGNLFPASATALADFLVALAELDRRRLYVELGWSSAWDFCCRALGLSETATHYRLAAARQIQQQPELVDQIRSGRLCITTLTKLSPVLTDDNRAALVAEAEAPYGRCRLRTAPSAGARCALAHDAGRDRRRDPQRRSAGAGSL